MEYSSTCNCGNITVKAFFPLPIEEYHARACDCDFCCSHSLAYLSDVNGTLSLSPIHQLNQLKQGSGQASFWQCGNCKQVLSVTHSKDGETRGAISKAVFEETFSLLPSILVSPKYLSSSEKTVRWTAVWSKVV